MIKLEFYKPLNALEIRDPSIAICEEVAVKHDVYVRFHQNQQPALSGNAGQPKSTRKRIGNGKHTEWSLCYQAEPLDQKRPTIVGRLLLRSPYLSEEMQFGGFDYGKYDEPKPTYTSITVHPDSEIRTFRPIDPSESIIESTYEGLRDYFESSYPRLFDVDDYNSVLAQ